MNGELKVALCKKKQGFQQGDHTLEFIQKEIRQIVSRSKHENKQKIQRKMRGNNLMQAWQGVYPINNRKGKYVIACRLS